MPARWFLCLPFNIIKAVANLGGAHYLGYFCRFTCVISASDHLSLPTQCKPGKHSARKSLFPRSLICRVFFSHAWGIPVLGGTGSPRKAPGSLILKPRTRPKGGLFDKVSPTSSCTIFPWQCPPIVAPPPPPQLLKPPECATPHFLLSFYSTVDHLSLSDAMQAQEALRVYMCEMFRQFFSCQG